MTSTWQPTGTGRHRIGAVAALSGLPANTIRTWERRYDVVHPERSEGGGRRYCDDDVERLIALRRLTEQGHAIGDLVHLDDHKLEAMLERTDAQQVTRLGVTDVRVAARLRKMEEHWRVEPILDAAGMDAFNGHALVVALDELGPQPVERAKALRGTRPLGLFVVYDFATRQLLEGLAEVGAWTLRGPLRELQTLRRVIKLTVEHVAVADRTPPRRFEANMLNRLVEMSSSVSCECPQHLAGLIQSLVAFETYSQRCEHQSPEDARLHRMLAEGTALARQRMEGLLQAVIDAEGLAERLQRPGESSGAGRTP